MPRPSVAACCRATLATFRDGSARYGALTCKSWTCPTCRPVNAARLLDRLRRGMESRPDSHLWLVTLTIDPSKFGGTPVGHAFWDANGQRVDDPSLGVRASVLWAEPTRAQFDAAAAAMSKAWQTMMDALNVELKRAGLARWGYFRVVELHRNVWPHYHVVFEHPDLEVAPAITSWPLGIVDARPVTVDDAIGEVAPYLVASESKGKAHKAYQFAAAALPRGFRLYTASRGFLGDRAAPDAQPVEAPEHALVLRGHFTSYHQMARDWSATSVLLLPTPAAPDRPHRPPAACLTTGDGAVLLYAELARATPLHERPSAVLGAPGPRRAPVDEDPAPSRAGAVPPGDSGGTPN